MYVNNAPASQHNVNDIGTQVNADQLGDNSVSITTMHKVDGGYVWDGKNAYYNHQDAATAVRTCIEVMQHAKYQAETDANTITLAAIA